MARTASAFLECGRLQSGFARIRCPKRRGEHLLAFSCQTRNFCPSCQAKRAALVAEKLLADVLAPVPHRHLIFTIPKVLRGLFQRERRRFSILTRSAYDPVRRTWAAGFEDRHALPGMVISIQTIGAYANWHPHLHVLVTNGVLTRDGEFLGLPHWTPQGKTGPRSPPAMEESRSSVAESGHASPEVTRRRLRPSGRGSG